MGNIQSWDSRRDWVVPGNEAETIRFAALHWLHTAKRAIQRKGRFAVALSGGSTPKAIFQLLSQKTELLDPDAIDWSKVWLFWSDERAVPPAHPDSNYRMAMESGFQKLPIPPGQIFRMHAESQIEKHALDYEETLHRVLGKSLFDLVMLGLGEDGHTASLFPQTESLKASDRLVAANYIPQKNTWRMTLTFLCIDKSENAALYALGKSKQAIVPKVLEAAIESPYPASRIGNPERKALWILDEDSAKFLL